MIIFSMAANETILFIDHDLEMFSILSSYLSLSNTKAQFTTRVREALRKIGNQKYTHIFVDSDLDPDNAADVLNLMTEPSGLNAKTPVTVLSTDPNYQITMFNAKRLHSILMKPFTLEEFTYHITTARKKT